MNHKMNQWTLLVALLWSMATEAAFDLRVMEVKMSSVQNSDMDGGLFGGRFQMDICDDLEGKCCHTGTLNTEDNNWELGERNYFVGRQLHGCQSFPLSSGNVSVTVEHSGLDAGHIEHIKLRGSLRNLAEYFCWVDQRLYRDKVTVRCRETPPIWPADQDDPSKPQASTCLGKEEFCSLAYDQFTFAGAHNAGTGMANKRMTHCFFKNQDLDLTEQLDFGLRFLDFDIIYSTALNSCEGLETGHGRYPDWGIYTCFGPVVNIFSQVTAWLGENPREVVTVHFGEIANEVEALPRLQDLVEQWFGEGGLSPVKVSRSFQRTGKWSTLGQMVDSNERLVLLVNSRNVTAGAAPLPYVQVIKVDQDHPGPSSGPPPLGAATVVSTYSSGSIGNECEDTAGKVVSNCRDLRGDLIKVAAYGSLGIRNLCLESIARECNPRTEDIMAACGRAYGSNLNYVFADYPNYPAASNYTLIELVDKENLRKVNNF